MYLFIMFNFFQSVYTILLFMYFNLQNNTVGSKQENIFLQWV